MLCKFGWHNWCLWKWVPAITPYSGNWIGGQVRNCINCGLAQTHVYRDVFYGVTEIDNKENPSVRQSD